MGKLNIALVATLTLLALSACSKSQPPPKVAPTAPSPVDPRAPVGALKPDHVRLHGRAGIQVTYRGSNGRVHSQVESRTSRIWTEHELTQMLGASTFSAEWKGNLWPKYSEEYQFTLVSTGAARLFINGKEVLARTAGVPRKTLSQSRTISLKAGRPVQIRVVYDGAGASDMLQLAWSSTSQPREILDFRDLSASQAPESSQLNTQWGVTSQNILRNGNFTQGATEWYMDRWDPYENWTYPIPTFQVAQDPDGSKYAVATADSFYGGQTQYSAPSVNRQHLASNYIEPGALYTLRAQGRAPTGGTCTVALTANSVVNGYYDVSSSIPGGQLNFTDANWVSKEIQVTLPETVMSPDPFSGSYEPTYFEEDISSLEVSFMSTTNPAQPCHFTNIVLVKGQGSTKGTLTLDSGDFHVDEQGVVGTPTSAVGPDIPGMSFDWWTYNPATDEAHSYVGRTVTPTYSTPGTQLVGVDVYFPGSDTVQPYANTFEFETQVTMPPYPSPEDLADVSAVINPWITTPATFLGEETFFSARGSVGNSLSYEWNFGDGTSGLGDSDGEGEIVHTYAQPGRYTATLTLRDLTTGQSDVTTQEVVILPDVNSMASSRVSQIGQAITFDVAYPVAGLNYEWTFPDGTIAKAPNTSKVFTTAGFQDITLTIYDDRAGVNMERPILDQREFHINNYVPKPVANLTGATIGLTAVQFDASQSGSAVGALTYTWDFGDGSSATGPTVNHDFVYEGRYGVVLTVTDQYGQTASTNAVVIIGQREDYGLNEIIVGSLGSGQAVSTLGATSLDQKATNNRRRQTASAGPMQAVLKDLQAKARGNVIYLKGRGVRRAPGTVSAQSTGVDRAMYYPYVLPPNPVDMQGVAIPTPYTDSFNYDQTNFSLNGAALPKGAAWNLTNCTPRTTTDPPYCNRLSFSRSSFPSVFPPGITKQNITFTGRPEYARSGHFEMNYTAFAGLRVPRVILSVMPDTQVDNTDVQLYTHNDSGQDEFFAQVTVPASAVTNGYASFRIPVFAVDQTGNVLNSATGLFNGWFQGEGLYSGSVTGHMINGRAEMIVYANVDTFANGATFDLTQFMLDPTLECAQDETFAAGGYYLHGCQQLQLSHITPKVNGTVAALSADLSAQAISISDIRRWVGPVNRTLFNAINYGKNALSRAGIDRLLASYEGSAVSIAIGFVPILGDSVDLLTQVANQATGKGADPVIVVLASIGLALDATTGGIGDVTAPLKAIYKLGGTSKHIINVLVGTVKTMRPSEAILKLKEFGGFAVDAFKQRSINLTTIKLFGESLNFTYSIKGSALEALSVFFDGYRTSKANISWVPLDIKITTAKFAGFSADVALNMARCGGYCAAGLDQLHGKVVKLGQSAIEAIRTIGSAKMCRVKPAMVGAQSLNVYSTNVYAQAAECVGWIEGYGMLSASVLGQSLATQSKSYMRDLRDAVGPDVAKRTTIATAKLTAGGFAVSLNAGAIGGAGGQKVLRHLERYFGITGPIVPGTVYTGSRGGQTIKLFLADSVGASQKSEFHAERVLERQFGASIATSSPPAMNALGQPVPSIGISNTTGPCRAEHGYKGVPCSTALSGIVEVVHTIFGQ